jgi:hypothetical protein
VGVSIFNLGKTNSVTLYWATTNQSNTYLDEEGKLIIGIRTYFPSIEAVEETLAKYYGSPTHIQRTKKELI